MKVLLICAVFCVTLRVSTLQPVVKRESNYGGSTDQASGQGTTKKLVIPAEKRVTMKIPSPLVPEMPAPQSVSLLPPHDYVHYDPQYTVTYHCPDGYTLRGTDCHLQSLPATQSVEPRPPPWNQPCPYGSYFNGYTCLPYNGQNVQSGPYNLSPPPPQPICPPGYQLSGGMCHYTYNFYNPYTIYSG